MDFLRLRRIRRISFLLLAVFFTAAVLPAQDIDFRLMPAPPTPEADYGAEGTGGFDVGVGYARGWLKSGVSANMNGAIVGTVYRGVLLKRIGFTVVPLSATWVKGEIEGFSADTWSLGSGFSAGFRIFGSAESYNAVLFGGGVYGWNLDRQDLSVGDYRLSTHFFGYAIGAKFQIAPTKYIRIVPFYVYMGGGAHYSLEIDSAIPMAGGSWEGGLGYLDYHLFGLDFNIYGVSAKFIMNLLGEENYSSFSCTVEIRKTIRGVKKVAGSI